MSGHIRKRGKRSWELKYDAKAKNGKRKIVYRSFKGTKREAQQLLRTLVRTRMKTPEGYEKAEIDKYLKSIGAYVAKPATFGYGTSGGADRLCSLPKLILPKHVGMTLGWFLAVEVKREGKEPTASQKLRLKEVAAAGGATTWGVAEKVIAEIEAWRVF